MKVNQTKNKNEEMEKKTVKHWRRKLVKVEKKSAQIKLKIAVVS